MSTSPIADEIDRALLKALTVNPDATNIAVSETTGLARNTVRSRFARYSEKKILHSFERRIDPAFLGYPLRAYIMTKVTQRKLTPVSRTLASIPEVLEVQGLSGISDLLIHVVARNADHLYQVAGRILDIDGVKRTKTGLVMRELVNYRISHLLDTDQPSQKT